jgi:hypothetical protein
MILIALLLCGCVHVDCSSSGRMLWAEQWQQVPGAKKGMIDGGMAVISCDWGIVR